MRSCWGASFGSAASRTKKTWPRTKLPRLRPSGDWLPSVAARTPARSSSRSTTVNLRPHPDRPRAARRQVRSVRHPLREHPEFLRNRFHRQVTSRHAQLLRPLRQIRRALQPSCRRRPRRHRHHLEAVRLFPRRQHPHRRHPPLARPRPRPRHRLPVRIRLVAAIPTTALPASTRRP